MRILVGHNRYQQAGGEDAVFESHVRMLKDLGNEVMVYERDNDEIGNDPLSKIQHVLSLKLSRRSYDQIRQLLRSFKPDVCHFHNIFFVMTPSVLDACQDEHVPVVVSLHNFRLMCINGLFFRDDHPCEDCSTKTRAEGIRHNCYRGSFLMSAAMTDMMQYHWNKGTWQNKVDRFIVATEFSRRKHIQAGISSAKITVLPHFVQELSNGIQDKGNYVLYAGRLSKEKGLDILLQAWRSIKEIPLYIVGTGPMQKDVEAYIKDNGLTHVRMLGFLESADYLKVISKARFLVVPSTCYENFPRVVVEAYACGVPVLANKLGTMEEIVEEGRTGLLFLNSDPQDLAAKVMDMVRDENKYKDLCVNARRAYDLKYTSMEHYKTLMNIYEGVVQTLKNTE